MAKQKGIIPLVGTIGGVNFYYLNGKPVARKAGGGFNGKAIKTKANMRRVRENSSEFGHCSEVNKVFRKALRPFYKGYKFTHFHSRLMTLFTQLKDLDTINQRGKRVVFEGVLTTEGLSFLKQFNYTPECDVRYVLPFDFEIDGSTFALMISHFDINKVNFISGATHIEINYGVLDFNFETLSYALHLATPSVLDKSFTNTTVVLTLESLPTSVGTLLCVLGVRFYQEVDGQLYLLNANNGVGFFVIESL
ncbi:MAG TPA: hypothetical protein VKN14_11265 [Flavobacteriaceae bacterium]|nr:hypothetical protein [Flavobacteriaceae bacterium]